MKEKKKWEDLTPQEKSKASKGMIFFIGIVAVILFFIVKSCNTDDGIPKDAASYKAANDSLKNLALYDLANKSDNYHVMYEAVKTKVNNPLSASFANGFNINIQNTDSMTVVYRGVLEAENSFGVKQEATYWATAHVDFNKSAEVISVLVVPGRH